MQRIERYGVIALIFLLVTIVAVSFWGDSGDGGLWSRFTGGDREPAAEVARHDPRVNARSVARSVGDELPLTTPGMQDQAAPRPGTSATLAERRAQRRRALEAQGQVPGRAQEGLSALDRATPVPDALQASEAAPHAPLTSEPARVPPAATQPSAAREVVARDAAPARREAPGGTYVVQSGDTLGEIAQKTLGSATRWKEIQAANPGLDPKRLFVGAKLVLPGGAAAGGTAVAAAPGPAVPVTATGAATAAKPAARTYVVRSGDTLSRIAASELGSADRWREIAAANPRVDPDRLFVGAQLVLPGARDAGLVAYAERSTPRERPQSAEKTPSAGPRVR